MKSASSRRIPLPSGGRRARELAAALVLVTLLGLVALLGLPVPAQAGPLPPPVPKVLRAQQCYGQGDLGCVLQLLENAEVDPQFIAERWRLLAHAAARLDRHDLARKAFEAWIGLSNSHRLDRATTLPAVWQDYQAALLARFATELDLTPQVAHVPVLPAPPATVADLPRYGPPPKSARDSAADFSFAIQTMAAVHPTRAAVPGFPGGGVGIDLHLSPRWRAGVQAEAVPFAVAARALDPEQGFLIFDAQLRAAYAVVQKGSHAVDVFGGLGGVLVGDATFAAGSAGLRYAFAPRRQTVGFFAALTGLAVNDSSGILPLATLAVGITLRPPQKASAGGGP